MSEPEPLSVKIEAQNGNVYTFSARDADEGSVPYDISWGTQNPGGFADASVTLMRPPWLSAADIPLFADVTISGSEVKYRGRVRQAPRGDSEAVTLSCEGLAAKLDDDQHYRFLGAHNDLSAWNGPSVERQIALIAADELPQQNLAVEPIASSRVSTVPALATRLTGTWSAANGAICEAYVDTGGMDIGRIFYSWERSDDINTADTDWSWQVSLADEYTGGVLNDNTGNLRAAGPDTDVLDAGGAGRFLAVVWAAYTAPAVVLDPGPPVVYGDVGPSTIWWRGLSIIGNHGIPAHQITGENRWGLFASDVLEYVVTDLGLDIESIDPTTIAIAHVVQNQGTHREIIEYVSAFGTDDGRIPNWGFYENGFFWNDPTNCGCAWRVNRSQMATTSDEGPAVDQLCRGVVITYTDGAGTQLSVGPPGSDAHLETAVLEDTTAANLAPEGRIKVRDVGITTQEGAILIGQALLAESNNQPRKGTVTIVGDIEDEAGNTGHASDVRATDRIIITDDEEPEAQDIVSTSYDHNTQTCTANVGIAPANIETLLARLTAVTAAVA